MIDLKLDVSGDLELPATGDIAVTDSVVQAVRIRLSWFANEWRLMPSLGFPYFEEVFVKNPSEAKIKYYVREEVAAVDGVLDVLDVSISVDRKARDAVIAVTFTTSEDRFTEEVRIKWHNTD